MSIAVIDYSFSHPSPAALKAAGVTCVGRYFGQSGPPKNLTRAEAEALTAEGIDCLMFFEYAAEQATGGASQAAADMALARAQRKAVGMPDGRPFLFAVDFDLPDYAPGSSDPLRKLGPVGEYFKYLHANMGGNAGAYGGYYLISRLFDAGLIEWACQTIAWSGGQWDKRAQLRQTGATTSVGGFVVDVDVPERKDFGQWNLHTPAPPPPPKPQPVDGYLVHAGGAGGFTGRAVTSADGGKTWS